MIGNGIFVDSLYPDPSWSARNKVFTDNNHNFFKETRNKLSEKWNVPFGRYILSRRYFWPEKVGRG